MARTSLVVVLLAACGGASRTSFTQVASDQFARDHSCASGSATPRPDITRGTSHQLEVSGCGADVIYQCDDPYDTLHHSYPASCMATPFCTKPGCATDDRSIAAAAFTKDDACPVERVTVASAVDPTSPPADVSADPERLALWTSTERDRTKGQTFWAATGCGTTTIYACEENPPYAPSCAQAAASTHAPPARQP